MDAGRKSEKLSSLKRFMDVETEGQSQIARVTWLFSHLEEYLDRWSGWLTYAEPLSGAITHDVHLVLASAVEIMDEEQSRLVECHSFREKWQRFAAVFRRINKDTSNDIIPELKSSLDDARKELILCGGNL